MKFRYPRNSSSLESIGPESLDPHRIDPLFDNAWYLTEYPDIAAETDNGWVHFVHDGEREGRSPGPGFDPEYYRRTHLPLEGDRPFTHYVNYGRDHGYSPREVAVDADQTRAGIGAALRGRLNPILLLGNDARRGGGPLLLLEIARRLRSRGWSPVFLLKQGGPLFPRFAALGPTLVADEGWDLAAMGAAIPADVPLLANTAWGALLADRLGLAWRTVTLVHEMTEYLTAQDLLEPVGRAHTVVASMPRIQAELATLLPAVPRLITILPGLRAPSTSRSGRRAVAATIAEQYGSGPVHLGAGYADLRKGFDLFLDAAQRIAQQQPDAIFVWLGELGGWATALADEARASGLRLLLPGFRADAADWYANAAVYLLTSRQDPGPTTVLDAAAVGVPFVGLSADIGFRDLSDVVAASGAFVDEPVAMAERAVAVSRSESAASRAERARFIRSYRSLDRYVDDLEAALASVDTASTTGHRPGRMRVLLRRTALQLHEYDVVRTGTQAGVAFARGAVKRARTRVPRLTAQVVGARKRRLVSVAVVQGSGASMPPDTIRETHTVTELTAGDRAWLGSPVLLSWLPESVDLHLLRRADAPPWELIRELEASSGRVNRIRQYDLARAPRWAANGAPPPRPRLPLSSAGRARVPLTPPASEPVRLARPIGIFLHVYYLDVAERIAERLRLIEHPHQLYVSTVDEERAEAIRRLLPGAIVRVVPNQGRDIAPKIFGFAPEHAQHDVVLHLHTKRSPHRSDLEGWLDHILDCLLPSPAGIDSILALFDRSVNIGMVSPALFWGLGPTTTWGQNRAIAEVLTWRQGWPRLPEDHDLAFAAGSMFWARSRALEPIQRLAVPAEAFSATQAKDGTLAHAIERLIGVSCAVAGLEQVFVNPGGGAV